MSLMMTAMRVPNETDTVGRVLENHSIRVQFV